VIIDEDSMLSANFLVLLDQRLRAMYDATKPFGGISVLLVGDFLQLLVTAGTDLHRVIYGVRPNGELPRC
jgi:PIF1-like helicase